MNPLGNANYWDAFLPGFLIAGFAIAFLPWLNRSSSLVRFCVLGACIVVSWRYMVWRVFDTLPPAEEPVNFLVGVTFTVIEALSMVGTTITEFFLIRVRNRSI